MQIIYFERQKYEPFLTASKLELAAEIEPKRGLNIYNERLKYKTLQVLS